VEDDSAEKDDDFEVDLEAVDVVSFALPFVSMGFKALLFESIPVAKATALTEFVLILWNLIYPCLVPVFRPYCPK
jgi:hypothetical protein